METPPNAYIHNQLLTIGVRKKRGILFIVASQEHSGLQAGDELAKTTINEESATPADRNSKFCFEFAGVWPACKVNILA